MRIQVLEYRERTDRGRRALVDYGGQPLEAYIGNSLYMASPGSPMDAEIGYDRAISCRNLSERPGSEGIFQQGPDLYRVVGVVAFPYVSEESGEVSTWAISVLGSELMLSLKEAGDSVLEPGEHVEVVVTGLGFYPF